MIMSPIKERPGNMRQFVLVPVVLMVLMLLFLTCAGCTTHTKPAARTSPDSILSTSTVGAGVVLGVRVSSRLVESGRHMTAVVFVGGRSDRPVRLATPLGVKYQLLVTSADGGGRLVFDSRPWDLKALSSVPPQDHPGGSMLVDSSERDSSSYDFNLAPGDYILSASTFGPVLRTRPLRIHVP